MPFGRETVKNKSKNPRITQRSHANALKRIAETRSAGVARRASVPHRIRALQTKAPQNKVAQAKVVQSKAAQNKVMQNERGSAPARGTLRENQVHISISMINNKINKLLELLKVDDPNTNIIMTFEQLNDKLDNLIELETKKKSYAFD